MGKRKTEGLKRFEKQLEQREGQRKLLRLKREDFRSVLRRLRQIEAELEEICESDGSECDEIPF